MSQDNVKPTNQDIVEIAHLKNSFSNQVRAKFGAELAQSTGQTPDFDIVYEGSEGAVIKIENDKILDLFRSGADIDSTVDDDNGHPDFVFLPFKSGEEHDYYESGNWLEGLMRHDAKSESETGFSKLNAGMKELLSVATAGNPQLSVELLRGPGGLHFEQIPPKALEQRDVIDFVISDKRVYRDDGELNDYGENATSLVELAACIAPGHLTEDDYRNILRSNEAAYFLRNDEFHPELLEFKDLQNSVMSREFGDEIRAYYLDFLEIHKGREVMDELYDKWIDSPPVLGNT